MVPWLIVEPFLLRHGYRLMRRGDDPNYLGKERDKLWLVGHERAKFWVSLSSSLLGVLNSSCFHSPHTYPAYDPSGKMVFIKTVPLYSKDSQEYAIWRMLDSPEARSHPDNHTVPVREILYFRPDFTTLGVASEPTDTRLFVVMDRFDKVTALDDIPITKSCYPFVRTTGELCHFFLQIAQVGASYHDANTANPGI